MRVAVLMTCHNRKEKTLSCLSALHDSILTEKEVVLSVYLTDDGCTDGTTDAIKQQSYCFPISILPGDGSLFWNGGMINSWNTAISDGGYDGYLWLNDDTIVLPAFWNDLILANDYCENTYGKHGIYVGSTKDPITGAFTYGGFNYVNKITLKDRFVIPNGISFQECEAAHGNITYVSSSVVEKMGVFCDKYKHGGTDHDYTYLAHKAGFPILVLPHYSATCDNDHDRVKQREPLSSYPLRERIKWLYSPFGYKMSNTLLFNKRCFPYRVPFVYAALLLKVLFPKWTFAFYRTLRK